MIIMLTISLFILMVLVIGILIKQKWNILLTLILIPFLVFNLGFTWYSINELWGQAREGIPNVEVELLYATVKKPNIYLVLIDNKKDAQPILHVIPYTKEMEDKISKANKRRSQGIRTLIQKDDIIGNNGEITKGIRIYDWDFKSALPKQVSN